MYLYDIFSRSFCVVKHFYCYDKHLLELHSVVHWYSWPSFLGSLQLSFLVLSRKWKHFADVVLTTWCCHNAKFSNICYCQWKSLNGFAHLEQMSFWILARRFPSFHVSAQIVKVSLLAPTYWNLFWKFLQVVWVPPGHWKRKNWYQLTNLSLFADSTHLYFFSRLSFNISTPFLEGVSFTQAHKHGHMTYCTCK